jgi:hypothetical protein
VDLGTSAAEFGCDVAREELGVAAGDVDFDILLKKERGQHTGKILYTLYFVQKDIVGIVIHHGVLYIVLQMVRIKEGTVFPLLQVYEDDMLLGHSTIQQVLLKQALEKVGFTTAAKTTNNFDVPVPTGFYELIEV